MMKPLVEKLIPLDNASFIARTHRTPQFEVPWHQHSEYELILFLEGYGTSYMGNYIGPFEKGDIFLLGSNLPHTFQKQHSELTTSAMVVHFMDSFWGNEFLNLPECLQIKNLLSLSVQGLHIIGRSREKVKSLMKQFEQATGFDRLLLLFQCLNEIAKNGEFDTLSAQEVNECNQKDRERIDRIFQYTVENFKETIHLPFIAAMANMSVPAFCNYFKKRTQKTYIDFLNEIRIGQACRMLRETKMSILEICYESGYNSVANFNKQFLKVKGETPSTFRKENLKNQIKLNVSYLEMQADKNIRYLYE